MAGIRKEAKKRHLRREVLEGGDYTCQGKPIERYEGNRARSFPYLFYYKWEKENAQSGKYRRQLERRRT